MPIVVGGLATFRVWYSLKGEYSADKNNFGIRNKRFQLFPDFGKLKSQF